MVHDRRIFTIKHGYKVGLGLSETANINQLQRKLTEKKAMTSFPANEKSCLYRKTCIKDEQLQLNTEVKFGSPFENPQIWITLWRLFRLTKNIIISKTVHNRRIVNIKHACKVSFCKLPTAPQLEKTPWDQRSIYYVECKCRKRKKQSENCWLSKILLLLSRCLCWPYSRS